MTKEDNNAYFSYNQFYCINNIGVVICLLDEYVHNQRIIKLNRERLADDWKEGRI